MKFKDFQAPVLFSSTLKALTLGEKNSSTFKNAGKPVFLRFAVDIVACKSILGNIVRAPQGDRTIGVQ